MLCQHCCVFDFQFTASVQSPSLTIPHIEYILLNEAEVYLRFCRHSVELLRFFIQNTNFDRNIHSQHFFILLVSQKNTAAPLWCAPSWLLMDIVFCCVARYLDSCKSPICNIARQNHYCWWRLLSSSNISFSLSRYTQFWLVICSPLIEVNKLCITQYVTISLSL